MKSYFEIDVNCSTCFNAIMAALSETEGVDGVEGHTSDGCLLVSHRLDESSLQSIITSVGRTIEVAGNGEFVMGQSHALAQHRCSRGDVRRDRPPVD